jgi:beta-1,2-mannosidase
VFIPLSRDALRENLEAALEHRNDATAALSQNTFSARYANRPDWAVGPFEDDDELTFELSGQWPDPEGIGWTSDAIYNPSVIEHNGVLHLYYRASPTKESLSSRIGSATLGAVGAWVDSPTNPQIFPTLGNELFGCEDPKLYAAEGRWFFFYNGIFPITQEARERYTTPDDEIGDVGCDINVAVSDDLETWTKLGRVVDHEVSHLWAKGAVIPRNGRGEAVKIDGEYLMFLSEGCGGALQVGRSTDLVHWRFEPQPYLDLAETGGSLHEVACAIVDDEHPARFVLDFFYTDRNGDFAAGQALYDTAEPFTQKAVNAGGALAWGGMVATGRGRLFAQGWDAPVHERRIFFYREKTDTSISQ